MNESKLRELEAAVRRYENLRREYDEIRAQIRSLSAKAVEPFSLEALSNKRDAIDDLVCRSIAKGQDSDSAGKQVLRLACELFEEGK